jgi:superfamily II DNA/RNA helicase
MIGRLLGQFSLPSGEFITKNICFPLSQVGAANKDVVQRVYQSAKFEKGPKLVRILREVGAENTVVFVETKRLCDFIAACLCSGASLKNGATRVAFFLTEEGLSCTFCSQKPYICMHELTAQR